ncbi:phage minor head protein [Mameliella alba]|uniref:phage minor head protein n=1 Tax=Mameliella alba TaxID=561184 RepID=UPI0013FDC647|nr:phage minor head protein [Mameliella alba]
MAKDTRAAFLQAIEPRLNAMERAFVEAFLDMRSAAAQRTIDEIIQRYLETGDLNAAVRDLEAGINFAMRGFYAPLDQQMFETFIQGGAYQAGLLPKRRSNSAPVVVYRFDARSDRALDWTRRQSARLITELSDDTRIVVRETLSAGADANRTYRQIRSDLIGKQEDGKRKGGALGLHSRQARAVRSARDDLENLDARYFTRALRDKRFDRTVRKAIEAGEPLSRADIDRIAGRYSDRLLQARGRMVARTEGNKAAAQGRVEAVQQMIEQGKIEARFITKRWVATVGKFTRDHHLALNGQEVKWGEPFISPKTGYPLAHPHDEGAPGEDVVNCRCVMLTDIDWIGMRLEE